MDTNVDFENRFFSVEEAAELLRISRAFIFKLIRAGKIKPVRLGRRTIIAGREIQRALAEAGQ